jgi:tetratricopeptide (TPR) repeat protein
MEEAVAEDPTYADGQFALARLYMVTNRTGEIAGPMQAAMDHIYRMPERNRFVVKSDYYFLVRQDTEKAMAALDMWADLFPDDVQAYEARLQVQNLRDDKDGALASLQTILELDPARRDVLVLIGDFHEAKGDFPAAKDAFQAYAEEFPEDHQVLAQLAGLARRMGNLDEARDHYDRALLMAPSDVGLMVGMGTVEQASGNFDVALEQYDAAMTAAGTPEERAQVYSAQEAYHMARGQVLRSIEIMEQRFEEASAYQAGFVVVLQRLMEAGTYAEAGRLDDAWRLVEEARTQLTRPFDVMAPLGEMDIYLTLEDADGIEATLPGVEAVVTNLQYEIVRPALLAAQGEVKALRGEYREAIEFFEEQRRLAPANTSIPRALGRCYRELGEYDQAVAHFQEALAVSPYGPRTNYEMALTYEAMGRREEARTHIDRALEAWADADPGYKWAQRAREAAARIGG